MMQTETGSDTISITVNGEGREIPRGCTLLQLLTSLELHPRMIVVEHNRKILRDHDAYGRLELHEGDVLELVHFVGGG